MFVSGDFIFLELEKTGSTMVLQWLESFVPGQRVGKHDRIPDTLNSSGYKILGAARNPWDWYVSLWSFSCELRGDLYRRQTSMGLRNHGFREHPMYAVASMLNQLTRKTSLWREVYSDVENVANFRNWLRMMYAPRHKRDISGSYAQSPVSQHSGYLSYLYLRLFLDDVRVLYDQTSLADAEALAHCFRSRIRHDYVIHMENLESDFIHVMEQLDVAICEKDKAAIRSSKPVNISRRKRSLSHYYDAETTAMVGERESSYIRKFGYEMPCL